MKKVSCPRCKKQSQYSTDNPFRPFCSERCKLIDLGEWANEEYKVPGPPAEIPVGSDDPTGSDSEPNLH